MTNRRLAAIVDGQDPLVVSAEDTIQQTCRRMWARRVGAAMVCDPTQRLIGIFTGRDAVRALAEGRDPSVTPLSSVMTRAPHALTPDRTALDALRDMSDGGFRHVPVVSAGGLVLGIVSRGDFKGLELDQLETEDGLWAQVG
jgi:CBS domain-containing protein